MRWFVFWATLKSASLRMTWRGNKFNLLWLTLALLAEVDYVDAVRGDECGFALGSSKAEFRVICPRGKANDTLCLDILTGADTHVCTVQEAATCSKWQSDCLDRLVARRHVSEFKFSHVLRGNSSASGETRAEEAEEWSLFVAQIVLVCAMNFLVGSCLDLEQLRAETHKTLMAAVSVKEWDPRAIFRVRAWKLGLLSQFVFLPGLSYLIGLGLFRESSDCAFVSEIARLGLFMLGTAPVASYCTWTARLFGGNMDVSVLVSFASILLSPLSVRFRAISHHVHMYGTCSVMLKAIFCSACFGGGR